MNREDSLISLISSFIFVGLAMLLMTIAHRVSLFDRHGREALSAVALVLIVFAGTRFAYAVGLMASVDVRLWSTVATFCTTIWIMQSIVYAALIRWMRKREKTRVPR